MGISADKMQWPTLNSGIYIGPTFIIFGFFSKPNGLIKCPITFIDLWDFFLGPTDDIFKFDFFPHKFAHFVKSDFFSFQNGNSLKIKFLSVKNLETVIY